MSSFRTVTVFLVLSLSPTSVYTASESGNVMMELLDDYDATAPLAEGPVTVDHSLFVRYVDVDDVQHHLSVTAIVSTRWMDSRLSWMTLNSPRANISHIWMPTDRIWIPDIVMSNAVKPNTVIIASSKAGLDMDGTVRTTKLVSMTSSCNLTKVEDNMYQCEMEFESWMYYGADIDLQSIQIAENSILSRYVESAQWVVRNATVRAKGEMYSTGTRVWLVYGFQLEKVREDIEAPSSDEGVGVSALPIVFLGFMSPFQFLIPLESSERLTFDSVLLLTGAVIAVAIYDVSPAAQLPKSFTSYCNYILTLIFLCILLSIVNVHISTSLGKRLPVLNFLKTGLFSGANRIVFVPVPKPRDIRVKRPHMVIEHCMEEFSKDEQPQVLSEILAKGGPESEQLTEIVDILVPLAEERARCGHELRLRQDWLTVGLILDRLLFILFFLVFCFCSIGFIA